MPCVEMSDLPTIRWGIIATGLISSWFVEDLVLDWPCAKVKHEIKAIGSSSWEKGEKFASRHCPTSRPSIYDSYQAVYEDTAVDIVFIGTPHGHHYRNCLDAIAAGKNVLCEKAFALNAEQAKVVIEAAREKKVYIAEAMWLRHRPLVQELHRLIHQEKVIGEVSRVAADFALKVDIANLPPASRFRNPSLGPGSLLDIGIYSLTWVALALDHGTPSQSERPKVKAFQTHEHGVEVATSVLLEYPSTGRQGIATSTTKVSAPKGEPFAIVHGREGYITIDGLTPSMPYSFSVYKTPNDRQLSHYWLWTPPESSKRYTFPSYGRGFVYEADNTALDILAGRKQSALMPWAETIRMMEIMDEIRQQGGTMYPSDKS
ncbi:hypothetical protein BDV36DRAFT_306076 [Aspergillus pseudocaelatus]|uniref:D-xylose 1-dehydrogenase (NADP(+), D-xylono-1,5-lactone-forming) n=1 Tax=Aspergillus pseudocaelatus TaxID=1825620 RepID=A0ABQ6X2P3_9EURO|nr:hypothetical protein BDV36DRAFT_306076 [Aspergillus pseudocaelatus]